MSAISNHPFAWSRGLFHWHREQWNQSRTCVEVVIAVAKIFFSTLASIPFLFLDLILTARYWCCRPPIERALVAESPPLPPAPPTVDPGFVQTVLAPPYPFSRNLGHDTFLRDAIETALKLNSPENRALYTQLIRTRGQPEEGREAPIEIYKWAAGCLIAHYLVAKEHNCPINHIYPHQRRGYLPMQPFRIRDFNAPPEVDEHEQGMTRLLREYQSLTSSRETRAAALLQIMVPSTPLRLGIAAQHLFNNINTRAQRMAEDHIFRDFFDALSRRI